jgi:hypothetical protein
MLDLFRRDEVLPESRTTEEEAALIERTPPEGQEGQTQQGVGMHGKGKEPQADQRKLNHPAR